MFCTHTSRALGTHNTSKTVYGFIIYLPSKESSTEEAISNFLLVYNDVNNQQDATTFSFINLLNQPYMFRVTDSHILRSTFWLYIQLLVQCANNAADRCHGWDGKSVLSQPWHRSAAVSVHCTQSCIYSQKVLLRMGEFVARNMWGWIKKDE